MNDLSIVGRIDLPAAGSQTTTHLIVDTRSKSVSKFGVETSPNGKQPADQFHRLSQGGGRWVRAKIDGAVFLDLPYDAEGGIFLFNRESEAGIILVVPQFHVVPWMMFLDEMVLQNESFFLRVGDDRFDICHPFEQGERLGILAIYFLEVGVDTVSEVASLSNVENGPLRVFEKIDTGMGRKMLELLLQRSHLLPSLTTNSLLKKLPFAAQHIFSTILRLASLQIQNSPFRLKH
jgi:hypothetical protein